MCIRKTNKVLLCSICDCILRRFIDEAAKVEDPEEVNYGVQPAAVANEMEFLRNFMTLEEKERILIGHDFNSFIKGCTFRGKNCLIET